MEEDVSMLMGISLGCILGAMVLIADGQSGWGISLGVVSIVASISSLLVPGPRKE